MKSTQVKIRKNKKMLKTKRVGAFISALAIVCLIPLKGLADSRARTVSYGTVRVGCDNSSSTSTANWIFILNRNYAIGYDLTLRFANGQYARFQDSFASDPRDLDTDNFTSSTVQGRVTLTGTIYRQVGTINLNSSPLSTFCTTPARSFKSKTFHQ